MTTLEQPHYFPTTGVEAIGICRAAVIGAGSMGAGIAAQFANAGIPVDLLDIPGKEGDRNGPAEAGVSRQVKTGGFMGAEGPGLVRVGNVADDLARLAEVDWIVEAVIEDLAIKRDLYRRIDAVRRPGTIVSSNTSTIPRAALVEGVSESFAGDFVITHFFNPPRVMQLVELVTGTEHSTALVDRVTAACRTALGKTVVLCRDTPGFIANRIGCYWMAVGILEAIRLGLTVEEADAVNAALGVPRTGVFGLIDLVGVDLVPHVWGRLMATLPESDEIHSFDLPGNGLVKAMVADGAHGRKTGRGFYRVLGDGQREVLDLATGAYRTETSATLPGEGRDLAALLADGGKIGAYVLSMLASVVAYSAAAGPEIAGDIAAIDTAMTLGYSWREGPFRVADRAGLDLLAGHIRRAGMIVPPLLAKAQEKGGFYTEAGPILTDSSGRAPLASATILSGMSIITGNAAAKLRDLGEGVACFEITTKMNSFAPDVFDVLEETLERAGRDYRALVLGNEDRRAFSAGADLPFILNMIDSGGTVALDAYIDRGQKLFLAMKYLRVPVVAAAHGFALGGGCEFMLHADAIVAHAELNTGMPETKVGLIPAWGGCTQLLLRTSAGRGPKGPLAVTASAFETIQTGFVSTSAQQGRAVGLLRETDAIVMHKDQVLPVSKIRALALVHNYVPPVPATISVAGPSGRRGLLAPISAGAHAGRLSAADEFMADVLASVLTGGPEGNPAKPLSEAEMMDLERAALLELASIATTRARMEHMLKTGRPLRN